MVNRDWSVEGVLLAILVLLLLMAYFFTRAGGRRLGRNRPDADGKGVERRPGVHAVLLRQSGITGSTSAKSSLWAWKIFFAAVFPILRADVVVFFGGTDLFGWRSAVVAIVGFFTPELWLLRRRRNRRIRIESALSYFLDLTVALLRSGLSLDNALRRASLHGFTGRHPLKDEVLLVARELDIGKDRSTAFMALADRTGVGDLRTVAGAVRMGLKRGAPVEDALEIQADALRAKLRERALRRLNSITVVALLPVLLCGLPIFLVVVYFPAVVQILETFRMMGLWVE